MTPRKIMALYNEYKAEFEYRDVAYIAICHALGVNVKTRTDEADDEDVMIDG